jgi:hypothetical protein
VAKCFGCGTYHATPCANSRDMHFLEMLYREVLVKRTVVDYAAVDGYFQCFKSELLLLSKKILVADIVNSGYVIAAE